MNLATEEKKFGGLIKEVLSSKCKMSVSYHFQFINSLPWFLIHSIGVLVQVAEVKRVIIC